MNLRAEPSRTDFRDEEFQRLQKVWFWFLLLGIVVMVVGIMAIGSAFITTVASIVLFGILLMCGGGVQIVGAVLARTWQAGFLHILVGMIQMVVGALMIEHPVQAAEGLTLMLAVAFLVGGAGRVVFALTQRFEGRGWVVLNGLITFLLGILIWRQWPESGLWVIGLFIGIDLVFGGLSWVMLALIVKAPALNLHHMEPKGPSSVAPAAH
jgi:uncharacterized membrane protein HdeD (DUF308 family)